MVPNLLKLKYYFFKLLSFFIKSFGFNAFLAKLHYQVVCEGYRKKGAQIGANSLLIDCKLSSSSKGDRFFIGDNCTITGVTLLGHDASPTLFIPELVNHHDVYLPGSRSSYRNPIKIGNNVFIGWGTVILPGVEIGNNVVIGAGSVVVKNIPGNCVAAGNPAKIIKPIEDYIASYRDIMAQYPERF